MWGKSKEEEQVTMTLESGAKAPTTAPVRLDKESIYRVKRIMSTEQTEYTVYAYNDCIYNIQDVVMVWDRDHWDVCRVIGPTLDALCDFNEKRGIIVGRIDNFDEKLPDLTQDWLRETESNISKLLNKTPCMAGADVQYTFRELRSLRDLWDRYRSLTNKDYC